MVPISLERQTCVALDDAWIKIHPIKLLVALADDFLLFMFKYSPYQQQGLSQGLLTTKFPLIGQRLPDLVDSDSVTYWQIFSPPIKSDTLSIKSDHVTLGLICLLKWRTGPDLPSWKGISISLTSFPSFPSYSPNYSTPPKPPLKKNKHPSTNQGDTSSSYFQWWKSHAVL